MIYDLYRFEEIIHRLNITPNQCFLCMILMERDNRKKIEFFNRYKETKGGFDYSDIEYLVEKGYLEDFSTDKFPMTAVKDGKKTLVKDFKFIELFMVTPKFKEEIFIDNEEAAREAYKAFPTWMDIDGKKVNIKNIEYEIFEEMYSKIINGNGLLHKKIIEAFTSYKKFVREGKVQGMGLKKALEKRLWDDIEELLELELEEKDLLGEM